MPMKASDPIMGLARGTAAQAKAHLNSLSNVYNKADVEQYIDTTFDEAPAIGMDPSVVYTQGVHETGGWSSYWWRYRRNPGGIGITGDTTQNNASKTWANGRDAARAHMAHLLLYATGKIDKGGLTPSLDPRYNAYVSAYGNKAIATTIKGLTNTWGIDDNYDKAMVARGNEAFPNLPNAGTTSPPVETPSTPEEPVHPSSINVPVVLKKNNVTITSQHGEPNGAPCEWYAYATEVGLDYCDHPGVDLAVSYIPCYAVGDGTIEFAGADGYYTPYHVNLRLTESGQYNKCVAIYGHLSKLNVKKGQVVKAGDLIGTTGEMNGPHLHFEVRTAAEKAIDPLPLLRRAASTQPSTPTTPAEGGSMATPVTIDYSSLPFKVTYDPIPIGQTNQRPGQKQTVQYINIHETDNTSKGANSVMHNKWLHNGAPGAADTQVSVHFFVDDTQAFQTIPLNEISWNAGCGGSCLGNIAAISIELCVNSDGNYEKAYDNVCRLVALLIKTLGLTKSAIKFHIDWSGKWCPTKILNAGRKQSTIDKIMGYVEDYTPVPSTPTYAIASPIVVNGVNWDGLSDVVINDITFHGAVQWVTAAGIVEARQFADPNAGTIRAAWPLGAKIQVLGWVESTLVGDENRWWIGKDFSRMFVGDTVERPVANEPAPPIDPAPTDPTPTPTQPMLNPDRSSLKMVNGILHYPTSKSIKVTLKGGGWNRSAPQVAATKLTNAKEGSTLKTAYWCMGDDVRGDRVWYLLAKDDGSDPFVNPTYAWSQLSDVRPS